MKWVMILLVVLAGCAVSEQVEKAEMPSSEEVDVLSNEIVRVSIDAGFRDVEIKVGDTVEWTNSGTKEHTITFSGKDEVLVPGGIVRHTFTEKGDYSYFCRFHNEQAVVFVN